MYLEARLGNIPSQVVQKLTTKIEVIYTDRNSKTSTTKKLLSDIVPSKLSEEIEGIAIENFSVEAKNKEEEKTDESLLIKWEYFDYNSGKQVSVQVKETATKVLFLYTKNKQ